MARIIGCTIAALLSAGIAQSAPSPHIRFVSLAEARAIALENAHLGSADPVRVLCKARSTSIVLCGVPRSPRPAESERNVDQLLLNVENAYWNLYGSYWQLYSREQALRLAEETWKTACGRRRDGKADLGDVAQAEGQYNLFRSQYLQALDTALENERQLRGMLGLATEQKTRLVPSDAPRLVEKKPDWEEGLNHALKHRPELYLARQDFKVTQLNLLVAKNVFLPLGRWLGLGDANYVREAQLKLARARLVLQDQELKAERYLGLWYRRMSSAYTQIKAARAQREAFAKQLQYRSEAYQFGDKAESLNLVLEAQRFWADALATECQAITTYNNALAGWDFARGDILAHAHVKFGEAAASRPVLRAVAEEHRRTRRQVRREPGVTADSPLTAPDAHAHGKALSLPALWKSFPPLRAVGELPSADHAATGADADVRLVDWKTTDLFPTPRRAR